MNSFVRAFFFQRAARVREGGGGEKHVSLGFSRDFSRGEMYFHSRACSRRYIDSILAPFKRCTSAKFTAGHTVDIPPRSIHIFL